MGNEYQVEGNQQPTMRPIAEQQQTALGTGLQLQRQGSLLGHGFTNLALSDVIAQQRAYQDQEAGVYDL